MKNMFKKYRIDYLLFSGFSSFITVLLIVVISISYTLSTRETVNMTSFYQQRVLNELYNKIDIQMRSIEQISLAAARNPILSEYSESSEDAYVNYRKLEELEAFLASITYATPIIQSIDFYTRNAAVANPQSPVSFIEESQARQEEWYPLVDNTDFTWIGEHLTHSYQGEQATVSFSRKVYSLSGDYQGLLVLNVKASVIQALVRGETPDANRVLLDSGGRMITITGDPRLQSMVGRYMPEMGEESGFMRSSRADDSVFGKSGAKDHLIVWAKHFNVNWRLVELTPWDQITRGSVHTAIILSLAGITAIGLSLFFTLSLSGQFINPIRLLLQEMVRYSNSTNKVNLPEDYRNEYGALFMGYRKLIDRIQSLYASLEERYAEQKKAEIKALQAMINPHFLYNTLDQLNWMALAAGQDKLSHILELMGRMFRIGLSNGESLISIREEFIHAQCYVEIQQLRWEEGLTVLIDVPEEIQDYYIPKMTLQPFIENAIMHGFNERTQGLILITAKREGDDIFIRITDNGGGLKPHWDHPRKGSTGGYGIRNVRERYDTFFASGYAIDIANNAGEDGTTVCIRLPVLSSKTLNAMNTPRALQGIVRQPDDSGLWY
ncbi:sensor histidine kinase [Paenibacillus filicis]|uniref:Sensor histidine kinase n=1 Tax=Paenibacillus gyeongsangnamensis TaxID=3388067 RepID=A0ABT4QHT0_9BACL|nr:sensor histidine kinase [Paenibacillus filicis]MCZ8516416.1 sensor histidine kinase [Paenibacillus filicis]